MAEFLRNFPPPRRPMMWKVTLYGGPFDGDTATIDATPPSIWVKLCGEKCENSHWYSAWAQGAERYDRDEVGDKTARYVYADIKTDPELTVHTHTTVDGDEVPIVTPELVPA